MYIAKKHRNGIINEKGEENHNEKVFKFNVSYICAF